MVKILEYLHGEKDVRMVRIKLLYSFSSFAGLETFNFIIPTTQNMQLFFLLIVPTELEVGCLLCNISSLQFTGSIEN